MNDKIQHSGIKGMKWGVRRYQNTDGSLTPAGKKRYGDKKPEGYTLKKQIENERLYNEWRHAKGVDKRIAKKKLVKFQKETMADINAYRRKEMHKLPYSKKSLLDMVTNDVVAGRRKVSNMPGYFYAESAYRRKDPNRRAKATVKIGLTAATGVLTGSIGRISARRLLNSGKIDKQMAQIIEVGSVLAGGYILSKAGSMTISSLRNERVINNYNSDVDNMSKQK